MKKLNFIILLVCLFSMSMMVNAAIYKWTDEKGRVHYGDEARDDAETVKITPYKGYKPPDTDYSEDSGDNFDNDIDDGTGTGEGKSSFSVPRNSNNKTKKKGFQYEVLEIVEPENGATIRRTDDKLEVFVEIEPELRGQDTIEIYLDGRLVSKPGKSMARTISGVYRGSHVIHAAVLDENKKLVQDTPSITIYMHKPKAKSPAKSAAPTHGG